jgi:hypothetical protein
MEPYKPRADQDQPEQGRGAVSQIGRTSPMGITDEWILLKASDILMARYPDQRRGARTAHEAALFMRTEAGQAPH